MDIGIWGDSITYGEGDREGLGWVGRLRRSRLTTDYCVYNFGVCGDTTEDLLKRFVIEANSIQPDIVVFAIGINDSKIPANETANKVTIEKYQKNIQELLKMARGYTDKIYIVGATKVNDQTIRDSGTRFKNETIQTYNKYLKELSLSENLIFIDVFEILDTNNDLEDGLHPNARGYEKLYQILSKLVK
ncbi:MAG: SGNH/GDSL hydrolase family protein [Candidatus Moraniibacteriota bacterium]|nr:MAG: SGNH/GDSL hydrolase family protein [Candidatus Moranbacteria bacterium]